jgi:LacI family transcriptional regulator, gluconate utilization system Gnt-I transcriptional repressor
MIAGGAAQGHEAAERGRAVRMEDVARLAGVSTITVSRALRRPEIVSETTRKAIEQAIESTGYVPNYVAGSLASQRTHVVAAVIPTIANSAFAATIVAMEATLQAKGFHLLLGQSGTTRESEHALISTFLARRPDGFFLHGDRYAPQTRRLLENAGIPVVEGANLRDNPIDMLVSFSNFDASRAMVRHLLERGRRRIGFVSSDPRSNDRARARRKGYLSALAEAGVVVRNEWMRVATLGFGQGGEAIAALLAADRRLDAVFLAGDVLAAGALFECQRRGLRVPGDVAIAGFDDQEISAATCPRLSTVHVPRPEIGRLAAEMIVARLQGSAEVPRRVDVGFEIRVREST